MITTQAKVDHCTNELGVFWQQINFHPAHSKVQHDQAPEAVMRRVTAAAKAREDACIAKQHITAENKQLMEVFSET